MGAEDLSRRSRSYRELRMKLANKVAPITGGSSGIGLAVELLPRRIRVKLLSPGRIDTPIILARADRLA
jgi:NAD(P)-dependent dehydrogenase (short-subunit alcohol dehydrogenase family)